MEQMGAEMTCAICLELFEKPIILPCGHNFCQKCLISLAYMGKPQTTNNTYTQPKWAVFNCPSCRQECSVQRGVMSLPENKSLTGIVECFKTVQINSKKCINHPSFETSMFCKTCRQSVCMECVKVLHCGFGHIVKYTGELISDEHVKILKNVDELKNVIQGLRAQQCEMEERKKQIQVRVREQMETLLEPMNTALKHCTQDLVGATSLVASFETISSKPQVSPEQKLKANTQATVCSRCPGALEQLNLQLTQFLAFQIKSNVSHTCPSVSEVTSAFLEKLSLSCDEANWVNKKDVSITKDCKSRTSNTTGPKWQDNMIPSTWQVGQPVCPACKNNRSTPLSTSAQTQKVSGPSSQESPSGTGFVFKSKLFTVGRK